MNSLIKLKEYLNRKISKQNFDLNKLNDEKKKREEISQYLDKIETGETNLKLLNQFISFGLFSETSKSLFKEKLVYFENIQKILEEIHKENFDINKISNLLNFLNNNINKKEIISNLSTIQNIKNILKNDFEDEDIKKEIKKVYDEIINILTLEFKTTEQLIKDEIRKVCKLNLFKNNSGKIIECEKRLETLKEFYNLLSFENIIDMKPFKSQEMMNEFFEMVRESDLDDYEIIEIFDLFIRHNFSKYYQSKLFVSRAVENNKTLIHDELKRKVQEKEENQIVSEIEENKKETSLISLTKEEEEIYNKIMEIVASYRDEVDKEDIILLEGLQDIKDDGTDLYMDGELIDWSLLILYIENILIPKLNDNKEQVINIFKNILVNYQKVEIKNQEIKEKQQKLSQLCNKINLYLNEFEDIINDFYELNDKQKNYYLTIIKMIKEDQEESVIKENINSVSKSLSWFKNLMHLLDLIAYKEIAEETLENNVSEEDLEILIENINIYLEEYNSFKINLNEIVTPEESLEKKEDNIESCSIEDRKNIVLFNIEEDISSFDEDMKQKFKSCIQLLYNNHWMELRKQNPNHMIEKLKYALPNGFRKDYQTIYEPLRIKVKKIDQIRTGLIKVSVNKNNAEKIKRRYNLKYDCNSIFIIIGVINLEGDHYNYKYFHDVIRKNEKYYDYVAKLFANPNADEKELFKIIDEGMTMNFKLIQKTGGE